MKKAFSLFEVIFTTVIASIITISSIYYLKDLVSLNKSNLENEIKNIDIINTKIFFERNNQNLLSKTSFSNNSLYYENSLLMQNVNDFSITKNERYYEINLNLQNQNINWIISK